MLDPQFVRDNVNLVKKNTEERRMDPSVIDRWIEADTRRKKLIAEIEIIRQEKNKGSKDMDEAGREKIREMKIKLPQLEEELKSIEAEWLDLLNQIPNIHFEDVPIGQSDADNKEIFRTADIPKMSFAPKDHLTLAEARNLLDFERGAKVAGSQFYYIQGDLVLLEMALIQFIFDLAIKRGFTPLHTPDLARSRYYLGTGYNPRGNEAQIYEIKDEDLGLIATAEVTVAGMYADEIIPASELPKKYIALSHCFRKEAGAYGKYSRGLYRVHQFTKLEMFVYSSPEESKKFHEEMLEIEKEVMEKLGIPYRVLNICSGDLGAMAAKKYDVEAWMPGRGDFGEVTSTSNCTDYQSRNLNIRYKTKEGEINPVHMLNGTAGALSRLLISVIENYQQEDGSILVPEALKPYMVGGKKRI